VIEEARSAKLEIEFYAGNNPKKVLDFISNDLETVIFDNFETDIEEFKDTYPKDTPSKYKAKIEVIQIK